MDSCGGALGRSTASHARYARLYTLCGFGRGRCPSAEVDRWSSGVVARKSYQRLARVTEPILRLSARGGLGPAPFGDRSARFAKPLANDFRVVLSMAEAFSSR